MGTLRSTQVADPVDDLDETPRPACMGYSYNGVTLGQPVEIDGDPATFEWDDAMLPNGECEVIDGELVVTVDEIDMTGDVHE